MVGDGGRRGMDVKTYKLRQIRRIAHVLEESLTDDEPSCEGFPALLLDDLHKHPLQILHIIMLKPPNRTPRDLNALPNSKTNALVRHNDITPLTERGDHTTDGRERLSINDAGVDADVGGHVGLGLHVHVLGAVEAGGAAGADAVGAEGGDGAVLDCVGGDEVVEVVGGEICDGAAVGQAGFGSCWSVR